MKNSKGFTLVEILIVVGIAGILIAVAASFIDGFRRRHASNADCAEWSKITSVGGCDRDGYCSALLDNGKKLTYEHMPVVGEKYCARFR